MERLSRFGVGAVLLAALALTAWAEPWTGGRGPGNRGSFPAVPFPKTPAVVWKAYLGATLTNIASSNALVYDKSVLVAFGQNLIAFAKETGEGLWYGKLTESQLAGDLLLLDNQLVVSYESGLVEGRNPGDGQVLWSNKLSSALRNGPVHDSSSLYFTTKAQTVEAIERVSGRKLGMLNAGDKIEAAPLVLNKSMLLCYSDGLVRRVEQSIVRWTYRIPHAVVSLTPATDGRVVIVNTPQAIYALNPFERDYPLRWVYPSAAHLHESATLDGDRVYVATRNNRILAIDLKTGRDLWAQAVKTGETTPKTVEAGAVVPATPIGAPLVLGKQLLVRMDNGMLALLERDSGKVTWVYRLKAPEGSVAPTRGYFAGPPAIEGDHVYFAGSDGVMYHLAASSPDVDPPTFGNIAPKISERGFLDATSLDAVGAMIEDEGSGLSSGQVSIKLDGKDLTPRIQYDAKTGQYTAKVGSEIALNPGMHRLLFTAKDNRGNVGAHAESFIIGAPDSTELIPVTITGEFLPKVLQVKPGSIICWTNRSGGPRTVVADVTNDEKPAFTSDDLYTEGIPNEEKWAWIVPADNDLIGSQLYYHCRLNGKAGDGNGFGTGLVGMISIVDTLQTMPGTTLPGGPMPPGGPPPAPPPVP
ncbi:MAG: outer membrane protein assembly factor BamB family protein [Armatimonadota bacterium]